MLSISPIKNVNSTLNYTPSFKAGVQTNYGIETEPRNKNIVEGGLFTGFAGIVEKALGTIFTPKVKERAESIQKGLEDTKNQKLNKIV
jgi:hypothetical protein